MSRQHIQMGTNVLISILGLIAVVIMLNYIGARHYTRLDWTSSQIYTLSEKTKAVASQIEQNVTLYVLWSRTDPLFGHLEEILQNYTELNHKISIKILDPDADPEQFKLIQSKYGKIKVNEMGETGVQAGIFMVSGDNVKFLAADTFHEFDDELELNNQTPKVQFKAEGQLTAALINVTSNKKQTICFTQGHGEWKYEGSDKDSLRHIKKDLELDGFLAQAISIQEQGIPQTCDLIVAAGPKSAFLETEANLLQQYFDTGGRVMLLLDPIFEKDKFFPSGLESFCAHAGIELRNDFVLETEPRRLISETPVTFIADKFYTHASVKPLAQNSGMPSPVIFSIVRSMKQIEQKNTIADILVSTSPVSWGETNLASLQGGETIPEQDNFDSDGPLTIAMASMRGTKDGKESGRLVVVGDSDFLSEALFVNASLFNQDFWTSTIGWLSARKELVSIAPKNPEQLQLVITEDNFANILLALIAQLLCIIAIGIVVIHRRRK